MSQRADGRLKELHEEPKRRIQSGASENRKGESFPSQKATWGSAPRGRSSPIQGLGSGFWEPGCFLHSLPTYLLSFSSTSTPRIQNHFLSPARGPSCASENANYFPFPAFPTSSLGFSFFKSFKSNCHLSISSQISSLLLQTPPHAVTLGD